MKIKTFKVWTVALAAVMGLASVISFAGDDAQAIRALRMQSNEAIRNHDAGSLKSFLADDYVITISTGQIERSRDDHVKSFAEHFARYPDVVYVRTPSQISISSSHPLAMEQGTWMGSRTTGNGKLESGGLYTAAWKKTDDGWKVYSELFVAMYCNGEDC